jgi:hypothetical protein
VLRRAVGVRGDRDLAQAQPVLSCAAVLQDAHLGGSAQDYFAIARADYRDLGHQDLLF